MSNNRSLIYQLSGYADPSSVIRTGQSVYFTILAPKRDELSRCHWDAGINAILSDVHGILNAHKASLPINTARSEIRVVINLNDIVLRTRMGLSVEPELLESRLAGVVTSRIVVTLSVRCTGPVKSWFSEPSHVVESRVLTLQWHGPLRRWFDVPNSNATVEPEFDEWGLMVLE